MSLFRRFLLTIVYGPFLVSTAIRIYSQVERLGRLRFVLNRPITSEGKRSAWMERMTRELELAGRSELPGKKAAKLREAVWYAHQGRSRRLAEGLLKKYRVS